MKNFKGLLLAGLLVIPFACQRAPEYDLIIRYGSVYDGSGNPPITADIAIRGDSIAAIGDLKNQTAASEIDATGLAVAPGFINMLSWATETLIEDGRSQGDIRQGVTLEIFGEGTSEGPLKPWMKEERERTQGDIKYKVEWTTLKEYLDFLVRKGVSCNVGSFIGATTVRIMEVGYEDRQATPEELDRMRQTVWKAMEEGALGLASSLIYPPAFYASTHELTELAKVVAEFDGLYISHLRSEGDLFLEGLNEFLAITDAAKVRSEIYHLKAAGAKNWHKLDLALARIDSARANGLQVTTDMYTYNAAATGLGACFPPWVQEGGDQAWIKRLTDEKIRKNLIKEISEPGDGWENFYDLAGTPDNILLIGFATDSLKKFTGKTLTEVAGIRQLPPIETLISLVIDNGDDVSAVYFLMSEENVQKQIRIPYMSFCSDSESQSPEGVFLKYNPHPRAYGTFARLLGKYVREEKLIPLEEAIRRLTSLPAENLRLNRRGALKTGHYADIAIFDPATITDHATFLKPQQFATGMIHVFVNGTQVLKDGEHTGATPGRAVDRLSR